MSESADSARAARASEVRRCLSLIVDEGTGYLDRLARGASSVAPLRLRGGGLRLQAGAALRTPGVVGRPAGSQPCIATMSGRRVHLAGDPLEEHGPRKDPMASKASDKFHFDVREMRDRTPVHAVEFGAMATCPAAGRGRFLTRKPLKVTCVSCKRAMRTNGIIEADGTEVKR